MSTSASQSQPGTSRGVSDFRRSDGFVEVDIGLFVPAKEEASELRKTFKLNNLKLVSIAGWGATEITDDNNMNNTLEFGTQKELQRKLKAMEAQFEKVHSQYKDVRRKIAELREMLTEVNMKKDEELHNMNAQLKEKILQILSEEATVKKLSKDIQALESRLMEERATKETEARIGMMELKRQLQVKKDKTDAFTMSQLNLTTKLRNLLQMTGFALTIVEVVISDDVITKFCNHILGFSQMCKNENAELENNRHMSQQVKNFFDSMNGGDEQMDQLHCVERAHGREMNDPSYAAIVAGQSKTYIVDPQPANTDIIVKNETSINLNTNTSPGISSASATESSISSQDELLLDTPRIIKVESFGPTANYLCDQASPEHGAFFGSASHPVSIKVEVAPKVEMTTTTLNENEAVIAGTTLTQGLNAATLTSTAAPNEIDSLPSCSTTNISQTAHLLPPCSKQFVHPEQPKSESKQKTYMSSANKIHGVNRGSSHFRCFCGKIFGNEKSLNVHIRKMTSEWKYQCAHCKQFFFYHSEHKQHMDKTDCGRKGDPASEAAFPRSVTSQVPGEWDPLVLELINTFELP